MTLNEFFKENPKTALAFSGVVEASELLETDPTTASRISLGISGGRPGQMASPFCWMAPMPLTRPGTGPA